MEIIQFNNSNKRYNVDISRSGSRCTLQFEGAVPDNIDTSVFRLLTTRGDIYGEFEGYDFIYQKLDNILILSKINEVYKEPEHSHELPTEEQTPPTKEELENQLLHLKEAKQNENKLGLEKFLSNNPILWKDGCEYGITQADQNEMIADKAAYDLKRALGDTDWKLEWHPIRSACREFEVEEFLELLNTIVNFVYPYRRLQEEYKEMIYSCKNIEELNAIQLTYELNMFDE